MISSDGVAICIIGMHRSGTSMVARLLNLAGLDLGDPAQFLDPQADNPLGFWENREIMDLNDRLLATNGGSWMEPPQWKKGWESASDMPAFREEAAAILRRAYGGREAVQWGWKDPRTTLTLPFWKYVVGSLRLVLVIRNPVDVAQSLAIRHGWSTQFGMLLWKQYMDAAFRYSVGMPMFVTFYDDYFHDPRREMKRLLKFCGIHLNIGEVNFFETIQHDQWHYRTDRRGLLLCRDCPDELKFMYFGVQQMKEDIESGAIYFGPQESSAGRSGNAVLCEGDVREKC
tara:strand:+ start:7047 stop:7904 length:858 start_codon:yes stop_codon:yes gene_type:complete